MTLKVTGHMDDKCVLFTPLKNGVIRKIISRASTLVLTTYALRPHPRPALGVVAGHMSVESRDWPDLTHLQYVGSVLIIEDSIVWAHSMRNYVNSNKINHHEDRVQFLLKFAPCVFTLIALWIVLALSVLHSTLTYLACGARWGIRFAKVAKFFATVSYCQIILILLYNLSLESLRCEDSYLSKLGNIELSAGTYLFIGVIQYNFAFVHANFIARLESELRKAEEEEQVKKVEKISLREKCKDVDLEQVVTEK
ncbi:hypothetical protein Fcan01_00192 [Folsomia candida]|uniref:Uncharacterized protein n=1 Tax=Folsomia candida TaxID=158441 RepID=A0A226F4E3_FOLCA|nr:hypothetical protein Fcan01_00192 [Folsomia candida]